MLVPAVGKIDSGRDPAEAGSKTGDAVASCTSMAEKCEAFPFALVYLLPVEYLMAFLLVTVILLPSRPV